MDISQRVIDDLIAHPELGADYRSVFPFLAKPQPVGAPNNAMLINIWNAVAEEPKP